jgi:hypothetical protein
MPIDPMTIMSGVGAISSLLGGNSAAKSQKRMMDAQGQLYSQQAEDYRRYMPGMLKSAQGLYDNPTASREYQTGANTMAADSQRLQGQGLASLGKSMGMRGLMGSNLATSLGGQMVTQGQDALLKQRMALANQLRQQGMSTLMGLVPGMAGQAAQGFGQMAGMYGGQMQGAMQGLGQLGQSYAMSKYKPPMPRTGSGGMPFGLGGSGTGQTANFGGGNVAVDAFGLPQLPSFP